MTSVIDSSLDNIGDISPSAGTVSDVSGGSNSIPLMHSSKIWAGCDPLWNDWAGLDRAAARSSKLHYSNMAHNPAYVPTGEIADIHPAERVLDEQMEGWSETRHTELARLVAHTRRDEIPFALEDSDTIDSDE